MPPTVSTKNGEQHGDAAIPLRNHSSIDTWTWIKSVLDANLASKLSIGLLEVEVISAAYLPPSDYPYGTSDPYVVLEASPKMNPAPCRGVM